MFNAFPALPPIAQEPWAWGVKFIIVVKDEWHPAICEVLSLGKDLLLSFPKQKLSVNIHCIFFFTLSYFVFNNLWIKKISFKNSNEMAKCYTHPMFSSVFYQAHPIIPVIPNIYQHLTKYEHLKCSVWIDENIFIYKRNRANFPNRRW